MTVEAVIAEHWGGAVRPAWTPLPHQVMPRPPVPGKWFWLLTGGRGIGKTDTGAHVVDRLARQAKTRGAIIAPTLADARETCVLGESGVLAANPAVRFNVSNGVLHWPNGSQARIFGAFTPEDVERLRGPQHHWVWGDELAAWKQIDKPGDRDIWKIMDAGLRAGPNPFGLFTCTPKPRARYRALLNDPRCVVTRATTRDNPYLAQTVRDDFYATYGATRIGRQELEGELLEDAPGALWTAEGIEAAQGLWAPSEWRRVLVAVDPAVTSGEDSDETGVVVVAATGDSWAVLEDCSGRYAPSEWVDAAIDALRRHDADGVVGEVNNGGDMIRELFRRHDSSVQFFEVRATRGKVRRFEPVALRYRQGRVMHAPGLVRLEDQMLTWEQDSDWSPDRLDAAAWGLTALDAPRLWEVTDRHVVG